MSSARRTIVLPPAHLPSARELRWPDKDPGDTLDFNLDCSVFLADAGGDSIVPSTIEANPTPTDIDISAASCDGQRITWMIGDGVPSASGATFYAVKVAFQTAGGLAVNRTITLPVRVMFGGPAPTSLA